MSVAVGGYRPVGKFVCGKGITVSIIGGPLHQPTYQDGAIYRRVECCHEQPVITPRMRPCQRSRGISPHPVGNEPFASQPTGKISTDFTSKVNQRVAHDGRGACWLVHVLLTSAGLVQQGLS